MSLFTRAFFHQDQPSSPTIFRLLDEINQYSHDMERNTHQITKLFTPKFDVKELGDSFELHRELPGIGQKNINIEFTDASTVTIKGHIKRSYSKGKCGTSKQDNNLSVKKSEDPSTSQEKFWVMERSIWKFSRSFAFPVPVNQENVKALMMDGALSIMVPNQRNRKTAK
ncbi:Bgt-50103 [Blumeria graminis f. sp. tritici]|uniref:Bgt-50103 n=1 Tax=Blumeria graminis f. sp. tritici TaxID=62690 RepID=A0A9X9MPM2_BLUGR|nr:Bgt-50103 [Blumeria graminis f. sp. tritici]